MRCAIFCLLIFLYSSQVSAQKYFGRHLAGISAIANNAGTGFGIQYEYVFAKDKVSLIAPINFCFSHIVARRRARPGIKTSGEDQRPMMVFIEPGFRFYPTKSSGVARYALGIQLVFATGKGSSDLYINGTNDLQTRSIVGIALSNSLNFHISKYMRVGLDLSLGVCNDSGTDAAAKSNGTNPFGQFSFNISGRF